MPSRYIPILIYAILAAAFPAVTLIIFKFIRPDSTSAGAKLKEDADFASGATAFFDKGVS